MHVHACVPTLLVSLCMKSLIMMTMIQHFRLLTVEVILIVTSHISRHPGLNYLKGAVDSRAGERVGVRRNVKTA